MQPTPVSMAVLYRTQIRLEGRSPLDWMAETPPTMELPMGLAPTLTG